MRKLPVGAAVGHALRSTFGNLAVSFNMVWPWLAVSAALNLFGRYGLNVTPAAIEARDPQATAAMLFLGLFAFFISSSIAVNWHRYILLDEVPKGLDRLRMDGVVWRYFGNAILIGVAAVAAVVPLAVALSILLATTGLNMVFASVVIAAVVLVAMMSFMYRWSLNLPAVALGRTDYSIGKAWADTKGNQFRLAVVGTSFLAIMAITGLVIQMIGNGLEHVLGSAGFVASLALQLLVNWVGSILAVTVLTSLYGFFVEAREF